MRAQTNERGLLARLLLHFVAHAAGTAATVVACSALAVAGFIALLAVAVATDQGPGGPLALPFLVLLAALLGLVVSVTCSWPACIVARIVLAYRGVHWAWELPLAIVAATATSAALTLIARELLPRPPSVVPALGIAVLVALPLLCVHWTGARIAELALDAAVRFAGGDGDSQDDLPV